MRKIKFLLLIGLLLIPSVSYGAIAFDNATSAVSASTASSLTYVSSLVGSGANRFAFVTAWLGSNVSGDVLTTSTFGGANLTRIAHVDATVTGDRWLYLLGILNPPSGTSTIVINAIGSQAVIGSSMATYSGVFQSLSMNASTTGADAGSGNFPSRVTSTVDNAWVLEAVKGNNLVASSTTATKRTMEAGGTRSLIMDSNAPITPAGGKTMYFNSSNAPNWIQVAFAPATDVATSNRRLRGVGISR